MHLTKFRFLVMIITLTSDFGLKDHYVGSLKGLIYSRFPQATIVDVSHLILPFAIHQAAYVVRASYCSFPEGTLHLILVDAEIHSQNQPVLVYWNKHYFLCPDNGILSLLIQNESPEFIISLNFEQGEDVTAFFAKTACKIIGGQSVFELGNTIEKLKEFQPLKAIVSEDNKRITGNIIYIDHYGNAVSNISRDLFEQYRNGRPFEILFRNYRINEVYNSYAEYFLKNTDGKGGKLALFNSLDLLEIAVYKGNPRSGGTASSLFGIEYESTISVQFL